VSSSCWTSRHATPCPPGPILIAIYTVGLLHFVYDTVIWKLRKPAVATDHASRSIFPAAGRPRDSSDASGAVTRTMAITLLAILFKSAGELATSSTPGHALSMHIQM
jgi:hypothetical protein